MKLIALLFGVMASMLIAAGSLLDAPAALAATPPSATSAPPTGVTPTSATLTGSVNLEGGSLSGSSAALATNGADTTGCYIQYGTTTNYGSFISCTPTPANGSSSAQAVAAALTVTAGTTYHYRVVIQVQSSSLPAPSLPTLTTGLPSTPTPASTEYDGGDESFTAPSSTAVPTAATSAPSALGGMDATLVGSVNAQNYSISACQFTFAPSGGSPSTVPCTSAPTASSSAQTVSAVVGGLSQGTAYSDTLTITYANARTVTSSSTSFTTTAATIAAPSPLTATSATLSATVDPEGQTVTSCTFYYGTSIPTLQTAPCSLTPAQISGTSNVGVSTAVTGLTQGTAYLDTVVLSTATGMVVAVPANFTTLIEPKAATTAATAIGPTTATLHATVNLGGEPAHVCGFEFGANPLTASSSATDHAVVKPCATNPAAKGNQTTSLSVTGLAPHTTYHFRVIVTTDGGYAIANTESFETGAASTAKPTMRITSARVSRTAHSARFVFRRSGKTPVTRGFVCTLVKAGARQHFAHCTSGRTYRGLKPGSYVFSVRGANAAGSGPSVSYRFKI